MSKWIVFSEEEKKYGKDPADRSIEEMLHSGFVIIDKPPGPTSREIDVWVKQIFGLKKTGHVGTLDPRVSGVLAIALENATKIVPALLTKKQYVGLMRLHKDVPFDKVKKEAENFIGKIKQLPPVKSAVARREREREIFEFKLLEKNGNDILFIVDCQAGTYIRKLIHDLGKKLGGAHMQELRRTRAEPYTESDSVILQRLEDAYNLYKMGQTNEIKKYLHLPETAVQDVPKIVLRNSAVDAVCNGAPIYPSGISKITDDIKTDKLVAIMTVRGELVALGIARKNSDEIKQNSRDIVAKTDRVVMSRGIYPSWKK